MLPKLSPIAAAPQSSRTIFINPNFKKNSTHINPKFLIPTIHVNPAFLQKQLQNAPEPQPQAHIISKSRTKIIREPVQKLKTLNTVSKSPKLTVQRRPLVKIGLRKLVRASSTTATAPKLLTTTAATHPAETKNHRTIVPKQIGFVSKYTTYKIDRRVARKSLEDAKKTKKNFVSRYALIRNGENLTPIKVSAARRTNASSRNFQTMVSSNKKLQLLNINGVLYKSTSHKLFRKNSVSETKPKIHLPSINRKCLHGTRTRGRALLVRGNTFVLDKSGLSLTRVENPEEKMNRLKRIDFGGLTYVARSGNVFIRTESHRARSHLSIAKHKSINVINMFSRNLKKTNVPCPMFQLVGKCAGFERGKCFKVHDKKQVVICKRYLKGECSADNCLLSHDVSFSKMPVCRFFIQGCCTREDCLYLHKKLSEKAEICPDFLQGFCQLAEKCNKRHQFLCPAFESKGKCLKVKCQYCKRKRRIETVRKNKIETETVKIVNQEEKLASNVQMRYFVDENGETVKIEKDIVIEGISSPMSDDDEDDSPDSDDSKEIENSRPRRPKIGDLPAFIPL